MVTGRLAHVRRYNTVWIKGLKRGNGPSSAILKKTESKSAKKKRRKKGR